MSTRWISPLRYPGGKARMAPWLVSLFDSLTGPMDIEVWFEPFGGGAGAALAAVVDHGVPEAWIVEKNPALAAFWTAVMHDEGRLAARVEATVPTLAAFDAAQEVVADALDGGTPDPGELAFSAFLVNRCSRSGMVIPNVGPIGGKDQAGRYTVQSRFDGPSLAGRLRSIAALGGRFRVIEGDGIEHIEDLPTSGVEHETFVFADPPYIGPGNRLYASGMDRTQHERLAAALLPLQGPWVLTYDAHPDVPGLYPGCRVHRFEAQHSAGRGRIGSEYLVAPRGLELPEGNPLGKGSWALVGDGTIPATA